MGVGILIDCLRLFAVVYKLVLLMLCCIACANRFFIFTSADIRYIYAIHVFTNALPEAIYFLLAIYQNTYNWPMLGIVAMNVGVHT